MGKTRIISIAISLIMACTVMPVSGFAAEEETEETTEATVATEVVETEQESVESTVTPAESPVTEQAVSGDDTDTDTASDDDAVDYTGGDDEGEIGDLGEQPAEKDYGEPTGDLLGDTSIFKKALNIYVIALYRSNGSKYSSDRYGDAVLIKSGGRFLLMDTGSITPKKNDKVTEINSCLVKTLKKIGVKKLDVYISHFHQDHTGGLQAICDNFEVGRLYLPDLGVCENYYSPEGASIESRYVKNLNVAEGKIKELVFLKPSFREHKDVVWCGTVYGAHARVTNKFNLGRAIITIIGPVGTYTVDQFASKDGKCGTKNGHCLNNCSLVAKVQCGSIKFLTCGDIEKEEEQALIGKYGNSLKCNLMKLSHHGLYSSNSSSFVSKVSPTWSFCQNNGYHGSLVSAAFSQARKYGYSYAAGTQFKNLMIIIRDKRVHLYKDKNNNGKPDEKYYTGWVQCGSNYQYYSRYGNLYSGWKRNGTNLYYLSKTTKMRTKGWTKIRGKKMKFDSSGVLVYPKKPKAPKMKTATEVENHRTKVTWKKVKYATKYQVYKSKKKNSGYKYCKTVKKKRSNIIDTKVRNGKTYYYKVRAVRKVYGLKQFGDFSAPIKTGTVPKPKKEEVTGETK